MASTPKRRLFICDKSGHRTMRWRKPEEPCELCGGDYREYSYEGDEDNPQNFREIESAVSKPELDLGGGLVFSSLEELRDSEQMTPHNLIATSNKTLMTYHLTLLMLLEQKGVFKHAEYEKALARATSVVDQVSAELTAERDATIAEMHRREKERKNRDG